MTLRTAALFLALISPTMFFVWQNQDQPLFGYPHDDGIYYSSAKSLADGAGYKISSFPGQPYQTKYPPGLPAYLALAWLMNPEFPANLTQAAWLQFLWMPALLALSLWHWRDWGLAEWQRWALAAILATNTYVLYFTVTLLSELPFTVTMLLCLLLVRKAESASRRAMGLMALAGLIGGIVFLMRTAGVVLLIGVPAVMLWRKRTKLAGVFAVVMAPVVVAWAVWSFSNRLPGNDHLTLYYTNYVGIHLKVFHFNEAHLFLWKNIDGFLASVGGLIFPSILPGQFGRILSQVIGVAAIAGSVRLVRTRPITHFAVFSVLASLLILAWSYPPTERFVLPMSALIWAGFLTEVCHLANGIRVKLGDKDTGQRVAAFGIAAAGICLIAYGSYLQAKLRFETMPAMAANERLRLAQDSEAYGWMRTNLPKDAALLSGYDALAYLYTGRAAATLMPPVNFVYHDDPAGREEYMARAGANSRDAGLNYVYMSRHDFRNDLDEEAKEKLMKRIESSEDLELLHSFPAGKVFRVKQRVN